jgi:nickel superoxide dismutase
MKKYFIIYFTLVIFGIFTQKVFSHCEIPCGIYDDHMRIHMMEEHVTTIEKSINEIIRLQKENPINYNQLVRWIQNKDKHADLLSDIVTQYFMKQRIKYVSKSDSAAFNKYVDQLTLLHEMLVHSMQAKQTVDLSHVEALRNLINQFSKIYFKE